MKIGAWWLLCALGTLLSCMGVFAAASPLQEKLVKAAHQSPNGVLKLNEESYKSLLAAPRDYAVFVQLTALSPRFRCAACGLIREPFEQVARGWKSKKEHDRLVFATIDAGDAMGLFRELGIAYVPILNYHPPAVSAAGSKHEDFDVALNGYDPDDLAQFLSERIGVPFKPKKPLVPKNVTAYLIPIFLFLASVFFVLRQGSLQQALKTSGLIICLGLVLTYTSGYMWTRIHTAPFMVYEPNGSPIYFTSGFQAQYGVESMCMIALYAGLVAVVMVLTRLAPSIDSAIVQRVVVIAGAVCFVLLYGLYAKVFSFKNPPYPFRLLI